MTCQFICRNLQISKHLKLIKKQHELKCLAHTIAMHSNNHTKAHKHTYNHTCNEAHCSHTHIPIHYVYSHNAPWFCPYGLRYSLQSKICTTIKTNAARLSDNSTFAHI